MKSEHEIRLDILNTRKELNRLREELSLHLYRLEQIPIKAREAERALIRKEKHEKAILANFLRKKGIKWKDISRQLNRSEEALKRNRETLIRRNLRNLKDYDQRLVPLTIEEIHYETCRLLQDYVERSNETRLTP